MQVPIHITFRNTQPSADVEALIRQKSASLEKFSDRITSMAVLIECPKRPCRGNFFKVRLHISMPGKEIVVGRNRSKDECHRDVYVAIRDAFGAAGRQFQDYVGTVRSDVKTHA